MLDIHLEVIKMSREEIIAKIKGIAENEKFKIDAFFFCGFPSGKPNQELMKACEKFIEADEADKADKAAVNALIAEMEAALKAESDVAEKDNITSSNEDVKLVLANKAVLFA